MSKTYNMVIVGGGATAAAGLQITVENGTATSVTASNGTVTVNLSYDSDITAWVGVIESYGTWTITATDGTHTSSVLIVVDAATLFLAVIRLPDVPSGYTQLEWVEGAANDSCYIDTGYKPISTNAIAGEFMLPYSRIASGTSTMPIFLVNNSGSVYFYLEQRGNSGTPVYRYYDSTSSSYYVNCGTPTRAERVMYYSRNNAIQIGSSTYTISGGTRITSNTSYNAKIYFSGSSSTYPYRRHYLFRIENESETADVCRMYPAKRNSDGVLGMYDVIREAFYTATGVLTAGPEM